MKLETSWSEWGWSGRISFRIRTIHFGLVLWFSCWFFNFWFPWCIHWGTSRVLRLPHRLSVVPLRAVSLVYLSVCLSVHSYISRSSVLQAPRVFVRWMKVLYKTIVHTSNNVFATRNITWNTASFSQELSNRNLTLSAETDRFLAHSTSAISGVIDAKKMGKPR